MKGDEIVSAAVTVAVAIVGVATLAVLVSKNAQTADVITAAAKGFTSAIEGAVSPITGVNPISSF